MWYTFLSVFNAEEEDEEHHVSFASYQLFVFVASYLGYCIMLYNRKSFTYTLPHVIMEEYFSSYEVGEWLLIIIHVIIKSNI